MRICLLAVLVVVAATFCVSSDAKAQTVAEGQQSVVMFDVDMTKIKNSALAKTLGIEAQLAKAAAAGSEDALDPGKLLRVVGAMTAPKTIAEAQTMSQGQMPISFYARMQFEDADSVDKMIAKAEEKSAGKMERDGKTYYKPPADEKNPDNMLMHRVDETTIEMATDDYAFLPNRDVLSQGLQDAWTMTGDDAIRIAIDIEGAAGLIAEAVEMGKASAQGSPQEAQTAAFLGLIDNMKNLRLGLDFSADHLLTLNATGTDEQNAQELQGGLDALLGMGKMLGSMQVGALREQDPDAAAVVSEVLAALKANREGAEVNVTIPHPEGLEALARKFAPMLGVTPAGSQPQVQELPLSR